MDLVILLLVMVSMYGLTVTDHFSLNKDYMSKEQTNALKGIFVLIVFISHSRGYFDFDGSLSALYHFLPNFLGQMMVIPFLFYSGFGVMESIQKKGNPYVKSLLWHRAGKVLLHFDIAVLLFCLMNLCIGVEFDMKDLLLALIAWGSVGNSNWFIFIVVIVYLLTWAVFSVVKNQHVLGCAVLFVLSIALVYLLAKVAGLPIHWYDTLIFYVLGMIFSLKKDLFDRFFENKLLWLIGICGFSLLFFVCRSNLGHPLLSEIPFGYFGLREILFGCFTVILILISMRIRIGNKVLCFFGDHVFSVYILQRIPLQFFSVLGISSPYLYIILSFFMTVLLAVLFDRGMVKLDRILFCRN